MFLTNINDDANVLSVRDIFMSFCTSRNISRLRFRVHARNLKKQCLLFLSIMYRNTHYCQMPVLQFAMYVYAKAKEHRTNFCMLKLPIFILPFRNKVFRIPIMPNEKLTCNYFLLLHLHVKFAFSFHRKCNYVTCYIVWKKSI